MHAVHLWWLHLEARLHALPQLPLADLPLAHLPLPELALAHARVRVVQAGHVVGQQGVGRVERHKEGVVAVRGRHDVGAGVLAEGTQGGRVWADVGRYGSYGGGGPFEGRPPVGGARHLRVAHPSVVRAGCFLWGRRRNKLRQRNTFFLIQFTFYNAIRL